MSLSYCKVVTDDKGCTHSVDNLVMDYIPFMQKTDTLFTSLANHVFSKIDGWCLEDNSKRDLVACSKYNWFRNSIWGAGIHMSYGQYRSRDKVTGEWDEYPLLRVKVNPNKYWSTATMTALHEWLSLNCADGILVKYDYAVDIPVPLRDVMVNSRKEYGEFKGTRYYGQRNKHGRMKVYDKSEESQLDKPLTRCEWTFAHGKSAICDETYWFTHGPLPLPDIGELSARTLTLAKLVAEIRRLGGMAEAEKALDLLDNRTRKKIEPYTIGTGIQLLECRSALVELLTHYCDELSISYTDGAVNGITIGNAPAFTVLADEDELPFA